MFEDGQIKKKSQTIFIVMPYFGNRLMNNRSKGHTQIGAYNVHQSYQRCVLAMIYNYVCIFEYEKSLQKNEQQACELGNHAHHKRDAALMQSLVLVIVNLDHLNKIQASVYHRTHAEYGHTAAHVKLARAVVVVVSEMKMRYFVVGILGRLSKNIVRIDFVFNQRRFRCYDSTCYSVFRHSI